MRALPAALALWLAGAACAQPEWRPPAGEAAVSVDLLTAVGTGYSALATDDQGQVVGEFDYRSRPAVLVLGVRLPLGDVWGVRAELPLSALSESVDARTVGADPPRVRGTDTALGNPYLGVEWSPRAGVSAEVGLRVPLARAEPVREDVGTTDAVFAGLAADYERFDAYLSDVLTVRGAVEAQPQLTPDIALRLRAAPSVYVSTCGGGCRDRSDVGLALGAHVTATPGAWTVEAGLLTNQFYSDLQEDGYGYRFFNTDAALALSASTEVGGVRPGLSARVPVSNGLLFGSTDFFTADGNRYADAAVGLSLDVPLR